jgi:hypothetical protein
MPRTIFCAWLTRAGRGKKSSAQSSAPWAVPRELAATDAAHGHRRGCPAGSSAAARRCRCSGCAGGNQGAGEQDQHCFRRARRPRTRGRRWQGVTLSGRLWTAEAYPSSPG